MGLTLSLQDEEVRELARRLDFSECGPCGGKCCKTPWTVFVTPADLARLERATGSPREAFAHAAALPEWEREAFGPSNLLFSRVTSAEGLVPQLRKDDRGACVFLDARGLCGVHGSKPLLCRLFPYYYEKAPFSSQERAAPLGTSVLGLRLLIDRGHAGFCPIGEGRLAEVEAVAGDAALRLCEAFEEEVASYETQKEAVGALFPRGSAAPTPSHDTEA